MLPAREAGYTDNPIRSPSTTASGSPADRVRRLYALRNLVLMEEPMSRESRMLAGNLFVVLPTVM
jgi:hypothetical protein